jgi:hypothetical protein
VYFALFNIHNINIYDDFSIKIYHNEENISDKVEIFGVTFFNKKVPLEENYNEWHSKSWYYKQLVIQVTPEIKSGELLKYSITQTNGDVYLYSTEVNDNFASIYANHKNTSWINKIRYLIPFNWLNALQVYLTLICIALTLLLILQKARLVYLSEDKYNSNLKRIRFLIYFLLLVAGTILRFNNPTDTILAYDYNGHLEPVVSFLNFGGFNHSEWAYPYPIIIIAILSIFKDINAVCVLQHVIALLSILGFIICVEHYYRHLKSNTSFQLIYTISSTFIFGILFLNGNFILFEKVLHHEGLIIASSLSIISLLIFYFKSLKTSQRTFSF